MGLRMSCLGRGRMGDTSRREDFMIFSKDSKREHYITCIQRKQERKESRQAFISLMIGCKVGLVREKQVLLLRLQSMGKQLPLSLLRRIVSLAGGVSYTSRWN